MRVVRKEIESPFIVETSKLTRVVAVIEDTLAHHENLVQKWRFEAYLTGMRVEEAASLEEIVELDNSARNRVYRLLIICSAGVPNAVTPDHEIQVDLDGRATKSRTTTTTTTTRMEVHVKSDDPGWASRTLAEIEEQVERMKNSRRGHAVALVIALFALVGMFLVFLSSAVDRGSVNQSLLLSDQDLDRVEQMLKEHPILTPEEHREIFSMEMRHALDYRGRRGSSTEISISRKKIFILLGLLLITGAALYLAAACYPSAVFLWGDATQWYEEVVSRRRFVWGVIIVAAVVSVVANFFVLGMQGWAGK